MNHKMWNGAADINFQQGFDGNNLLLCWIEMALFDLDLVSTAPIFSRHSKFTSWTAIRKCWNVNNKSISIYTKINWIQTSATERVSIWLSGSNAIKAKAVIWTSTTTPTTSHLCWKAHSTAGCSLMLTFFSISFSLNWLVWASECSSDIKYTINCSSWRSKLDGMRTKWFFNAPHDPYNERIDFVAPSSCITRFANTIFTSQTMRFMDTTNELALHCTESKWKCSIVT